jgi:hypothetical protein
MDPMKVLHLIDSLEFTDCARQLQILGPALRDDHLAIEICCLGRETPSLESLRRCGVVVHALGWTRWFDPRVLMELRCLLRESTPDVIHVWGSTALRTLAIIAPDFLPRVVMSGEMPVKGQPAWFDRWLLKQVRHLVLDSFALPNVTAVDAPAPDLRIACIEPSYRHAIWCFDFVRLLYPDATLDILGAAGERVALEAIVHGLDCGGSVQIHGVTADAQAIMRDAAIIWLPALTDRGMQSALEAMALGRPVIASNVPCLREIIHDGATGCLFAPGDVIQLARRTRVLLDDAALRMKLGQAARDHVAQQFPLQKTVARWRELYHRVAA